MEPFKIPKKVNRHVIKAIDFLQTSRTDFVHIEAIEDQVKRSLRHTKPVRNLEESIKESLRKQTDLGIISRSGSSMFGMTLAFQGLRSDRNAHKVKKNKYEAHKRAIEYLSVDEIASVRKILHGIQKPLVKTKSSVLSRALYNRKSSRSPLVRPKKSVKNSPAFMCDNLGMNIENFNVNVPKKVNRHVFKAIRNITNDENCEFVPLDKIKRETKWSMKNLNPLQNVDMFIERSLTNLSNMGVLSERLGTYRLNPVQSLPAGSSFEIFGKQSKFYVHEAPIDEPMTTNVDELQNISYMDRCEMHLDEPMPDNSKFSVFLGTMQSSTYSQAEQTSPLYPINTNFRASEGVFGEQPNVENAASIQLRPFNGPLVPPDYSSQEIQGSDDQQDISYMQASELNLDEPMSDHTSTLISITRDFRASEEIFGVEPENATSENISQERHNAYTDYNFEIGIGEPYLQSVSNELPTLFLREADFESEESLPTETSEHQGEPDEQ